MANGFTRGGQAIGQGLQRLGVGIGRRLRQRRQVAEQIKQSERLAKELEETDPQLSRLLKSGVSFKEALKFREVTQVGRALGGGGQPQIRQAPSRFKGLLPTETQPVQPEIIERRPTRQPTQPTAEAPRLRKIRTGGLEFEIPKSAAERKREARAKGREKGLIEGFKQAEGIKRAFKKLGSITRQFNEALPTGSKFPLEQRISGALSLLGARTGIKSNPKLLALRNTAKLQLRAILRDMGEGARLSDQDITQNIAIIEQATLTGEEREAQTRSFMQTALDSMDDNVLDIIREDPGSVKMLQSFGLTIPGTQGQIPAQTFTTPSGVSFTVEEVR